MYIPIVHSNIYSIIYCQTVGNVDPLQGQPWPAPRSNNGACCLNYDDDHPQLLISGGVNSNNTTLRDSWVFDVDTGRWTEVCLHAIILY